MVACLPQAAPSFRLSCDYYRRLAILISLGRANWGQPALSHRGHA